MECHQCLNCRDDFEKRNKGYNRHSVIGKLSTTTNVSILCAIEECFKVKVDEYAFICSTCRNLLNKVYTSFTLSHSFENRTHPNSCLGKRRHSSSSPVSPKLPRTEQPQATFPVLSFKRRTKKSILKRPMRHNSTMDTAIRYLNQRQYLKAARCLLDSSTSLRNAVIKAVGETIQKEIKQLSKDKDSPFFLAECQDILHFNWSDTLDWLFSNAPNLSKILHYSQKCSRSSERIRRQSVGLIASHILYRSNPKFKLIPSLNSLLMWMGGCKSSVITQFSKTGFCISPTSTRRVIDAVRSSFDKDLLAAKASIEESMPITNVEQHDEESLWEDISVEHESQTSNKIHPGFTMCWDNIGKKSTARHQGPDSQSKMNLWALAFSVVNRVPSTSLSLTDCVDAVALPMETFLLTSEDVENIKERMRHAMSNILIQYIDAFRSVDVLPYIEHELSDVMARKSKVVNMGVYQENPSTLSGSVAILEALHKYVPSKEGRCSPVVLYGDGLSCERHNSAHDSRVTCDDMGQRLEGLEPSPQEFHKRMLCLQDTFNELFKGCGAKDVGTLYHLKNVFNHRSVEKDVSKCFNHAVDLLNEATDAYTVLLALEHLHLDTVDSPLEDVSNAEDVLMETVTHLVDTIWDVPDTRLTTPLPSMTLDYPYCQCHTEDEDESMVKCGNHVCPNGTWFHYACVGITQEIIDGLGDQEWYCSDACKDRNHTPTYPYCICKMDMGEEEPMVECGSKSCGGQWFHWTCMGLKRKDIPKGRKKWYCSQQCSGSTKKRTKSEPTNPDVDGKLQYVKRLVWHGITDRVRHSTVKNGDGPGSILMWKMDLPSFFTYNHPKYVILAHRLLAGVGGWLPAKLRQDVIWNRTANVVGGVGNNIPLDLLNEFMNREFIESLKYGGRMTPVSVDRHGKMIGSFAKKIKSSFAKVSCSQRNTGYSATEKRNATVSKMISLLSAQHLTCNIPGRNFKNSTIKFCPVVDKVRFRQKLTELSNRLDRRRRIRRTLNE